MCNPPLEDDLTSANAYMAAQRIRDKLAAAFGHRVQLVLPSEVALFVQTHFDSLARDARIIRNAPKLEPRWLPNFEPDMPDYAVSG